MKRGELWTASGNDYAGKPRPAVIIRDDHYAAMESVTLLPCSSVDPGDTMLRLSLLPTADNGLNEPTWVQTDKVTTLHRSKLGKKIGKLTRAEMEKIEIALLTYLGLGG